MAKVKRSTMLLRLEQLLLWKLILLTISLSKICHLILISNADGLDVFPNLKILILDHNNFRDIVSLPSMAKLETLSLSYNALRDLDSFLFQIS